MRRRRPTVSELAEALLVFEEPVLNSRFHQLLAWHGDEDERKALLDIPQKVLAIHHAVRSAGFEWEALAGSAGTLSNEFLEQGERALLNAFLEVAESQIRMLAFMATKAPTQACRAQLYEAAEMQREVAETLRGVLQRAQGPVGGARKKGPLRSVQEEVPGAGLRQQVEDAIRASRASRKEPRELIVSGNALRHLRDEGLFRDRCADVLRVPVVVDLGWEASAFALRTFESVELQEILDDA